jgi:putative membrane protein
LGYNQAEIVDLDNGMQLTELEKQKNDPSREWAKAVVLLAMSVYLAILVLTGNIYNYMNQSLIWLVVVAVVLFGFMGVWQLILVWRNPMYQHQLSDNLEVSHAGHNHSRVTWGWLAIAAIPLLFALVFPSTPLGAEAVNGNISLNPVGVGNASAFSRAPQDRNILDWLREFNRINNPASFNDLPVNVLGFVYREPDMPANQFLVARFTVSCCVADAFAIGLPVQLENAQDYETGTWVQVQGNLQAGQFGDETVPIVIPSEITIAEAPNTPYLYP